MGISYFHMYLHNSLFFYKFLQIIVVFLPDSHILLKRADQ